MNKTTKSIYTILLPLAIIILCANLFAWNEIKSEIEPSSRSEGSVDFQIGTSSYGGEYEPEHVFAIWVTDENDQFVRTLVRRAWEEIGDLVKWNNMTGGNYQNAIVTGATMNNHTTHNISWDCTDNFLSPIPDGVYRIYTEFSEDETSTGGPWTMVEFTKGPDPITLTPTAGNNFHNIELIYTPIVATIEITTPANNTVIEILPFDVEFIVENFDPIAGDGLIGYYLNGGLVQMYDNLNPITIDDLAEGENMITLILLDEFGILLDPEVSDAVTVIYEPNEAGNVLVETSRLLGNYPNPFNPTTTIFFKLNTEINENTELIIYNLKGQAVRNFSIFNSQSSITWDGTDENDKLVSSGVYYYVLKFGNVIDSKKMLLLK